MRNPALCAPVDLQDCIENFRSNLPGRDSMPDTQMCYYPDGTVAQGDTPCHSSSIGDGSSACCAAAHICLSNGLCLHTNVQEAIARGSCTDKTWQSLECAEYCSDRKPQLEGGPRFCLGKTWLIVLQSVSAVLTQ